MNRARTSLALICATLGAAAAFGSAGPAAAAAPSGTTVITYDYHPNGPNAAAVRTSESLAALCGLYSTRAHYLTDLNDPVYGPSFFASIEQLNGLKLVLGSTGPDTLNRGSGNQWILGFEGADHISAGSGNDFVCGGTDGDTISLGSGNDEGFGGSGADAIDGGSGNDLLDGGADADALTGGSGDDRLVNAGAGCAGGSGNNSFAC